MFEMIFLATSIYRIKGCLFHIIDEEGSNLERRFSKMLHFSGLNRTAYYQKMCVLHSIRRLQIRLLSAYCMCHTLLNNSLLGFK